jgi:hypothetical protein
VASGPGLKGGLLQNGKIGEEATGAFKNLWAKKTIL